MRRPGKRARDKNQVINGCINTGVISSADVPGSLKAKTVATLAKHVVVGVLQMAGAEKATFTGCRIFTGISITAKTCTAHQYSCTSTESHKQSDLQRKRIQGAKYKYSS